MSDNISYLNYHASTIALNNNTVLTELLDRYTPNKKLTNWIIQMIYLCTPSRIHLCDGSESENCELLKLMVHSGILIPLNYQIRPNSYLARSPPSDVARVEERTFICSEKKEDAGYTNNWTDPSEMKNNLKKLFSGCMKGRTMYVVPFCMGPLNSPFSEIGIEVTDSAYVVVNMRIMTRMGNAALRMLDDGTKFFVPAMHSVGAPLNKNDLDSTWPSNPDNKYIVHFPLEKEIWSYGSGYGGNALLGKKCFALRIASTIGREAGWLAEHMLIVGITNPQGVKKYVCAAFPSACGKTNLAMLEPKLPGWRVECVGDDIAWLRIGADGRLYAVNPESGFFGVAPGTSYDSNPNAMRALKANSIFTNVAMKADGDVYWEGMSKVEPDIVTSWLRTERYAGSGWEAAHPNSRFTAPARQCPVMDADWENPRGVPISAIIFGGRRSTVMPLVYQSRSWAHGVFIGASMTSETTAAAAGARGVLRPDPFAMKPFCGYNMADYFGHWLSFANRTDEKKLPKIFHVNWFRKNSTTNKIVWPGFGDNIRVLDWILQRCDENFEPSKIARDTPLGFEPTKGSINIDGLNLTPEAMEEILTLDDTEWLEETKRTREFFSNFGDRLPKEIANQLDQVEARFKAHKEAAAASTPAK